MDNLRRYRLTFPYVPRHKPGGAVSKKKKRARRLFVTKDTRTSVRTNSAAGGTLPYPGPPSKSRSAVTITCNRVKLLGPNLSDYRTRIARGNTATTGLTVSDQKYDQETGLVYTLVFSSLPRLTNWTYSYQEGPLASTLLVPADAAGISLSTANADALAKFVQKATEARNSLQGLTFIGELRESLHMIRNPAQQLFTKKLPSYHEVVKKRLRGIQGQASRTRVVRDSWLEYSFGWAPLVSDILAGAKALARYNTYNPDRVRVSAEGKNDTRTVTMTTSVLSGWNCNITEDVQVNARVKYYGAVRTTTPDAPDMQRACETFGIRWNEVLPTAWELIPYSFLVDYFVNVQSVIQGFSFPRGAIAWMNKGTLQQNLTVRSVNPTSIAVAKTGVVVESACKRAVQTASNSRKDRQPYTGSLIPEWRFKIPGMGLKWLNMAALTRFRSFF